MAKNNGKKITDLVKRYIQGEKPADAKYLIERSRNRPVYARFMQTLPWYDEIAGQVKWLQAYSINGYDFYLLYATLDNKNASLTAQNNNHAKFYTYKEQPVSFAEAVRELHKTQMAEVYENQSREEIAEAADVLGTRYYRIAAAIERKIVTVSGDLVPISEDGQVQGDGIFDEESQSLIANLPVKPLLPASLNAVTGIKPTQDWRTSSEDRIDEMAMPNIESIRQELIGYVTMLKKCYEVLQCFETAIIANRSAGSHDTGHSFSNAMREAHTLLSQQQKKLANLNYLRADAEDILNEMFMLGHIINANRFAWAGNHQAGGVYLDHWATDSRFSDMETDRVKKAKLASLRLARDYASRLKLPEERQKQIEDMMLDSNFVPSVPESLYVRLQALILDFEQTVYEVEKLQEEKARQRRNLVDQSLLSKQKSQKKLISPESSSVSAEKKDPSPKPTTPRGNTPS